MTITQDKSFIFLDNVSSLGISVISCGELLKIKPEHYLKERQIDFFGLSHIYEGSGTFKSLTGGTYSVNAGDTFILFPGERHSYGPPASGYWKEIWLFFKGSLIEHLHDQGHMQPRHPIFRPQNPVVIKRLLDKVIAAAWKDDDYQKKNIPGWLFQTLHELVNFSENVPTKPHVCVIHSIVSNIIADPSKPVDFRSIATDYGLSYSLLRKRFTEITGHSPNRFLKMERIRLAKRLLGEGMSVKMTASKVGIEDPYYLSRIFSRTVGLSPKDYSQYVKQWSQEAKKNPDSVSNALKVTGFKDHSLESI